MKIRVGYGLGVNSLTNDQERFGAFVDDLERLRFDSLWVSERVAGQSPDPVVAMSYAAGRTRKLKFGMSVMVLPGRNPVLVAKSLASLDRLSNGRLLPAFGLGAPTLAEWAAFGIDRKDRAPWFDEALPLMRRLWTEEAVTHHGERFNFEDLNVLPKPTQRPPDVWLGGQAASELRRVGRLADGWLPSFTLPAEVGTGIDKVKQVAAEHGREIEEDHYGVLVAYRHGPLSDAYVAASRARRPELDPTEVIPEGFDALRQRLEQFTEVGASKFVLVPVAEPETWTPELEAAAELVARPLEN
ncbi:MAG: TIGR03619 family F420-dependent LLM class oxidoreductase [Acidimicrobiia bacterium]|nr:TIGR03619 family F420-dependent LLM class oxidoreductase [Acidimicrobiia bacterium]